MKFCEVHGNRCGHSFNWLVHLLGAGTSRLHYAGAAMNPETLRKAVELADGFYITHIYDGEDIVAWTDSQYPPSFVLQSPSQWGLDVLAAQLVRQVRKTHEFMCLSGDVARVYAAHNHAEVWEARGGDDTKNTIRACVQFLTQQAPADTSA